LAGTLNPIGDLYKLEVYQIAKEINGYFQKEVIPRAIMAKAPSAELAPGQTDEAALMPYVLLDRVVEAYVEDYVSTLPRFLQWLAHNENIFIEKGSKEEKILIERYAKMIKRIDNMEFKRRQTAPCFKMTRKAFGVGRRLPIVKK
jgi:NH3-dependent NAD+ synthetase